MNCIVIFDKNSSFNKAGISGQVTLHQCSRKSLTKIHFQLQGCKPNHTFGCHVHKCGDLSEGCKSACAHFDPYINLHGSRELYGIDRHVGDICNNLTSDAKGNVDFVWNDELISLYCGKNCVIGRMIVLHDKPDDLGKYRETNKESATTGNAGDRIACAIIGISDKDFHNSK
jgi:Cu-Zn family superoxide dismutase